MRIRQSNSIVQSPIIGYTREEELIFLTDYLTRTILKLDVNLLKLIADYVTPTLILFYNSKKKHFRIFACQPPTLRQNLTELKDDGGDMTKSIKYKILESLWSQPFYRPSSPFIKMNILVGQWFIKMITVISYSRNKIVGLIFEDTTKKENSFIIDLPSNTQYIQDDYFCNINLGSSSSLLSLNNNQLLFCRPQQISRTERRYRIYIIKIDDDIKKNSLWQEIGLLPKDCLPFIVPAFTSADNNFLRGWAISQKQCYLLEFPNANSKDKFKFKTKEIVETPNGLYDCIRTHHLFIDGVFYNDFSNWKQLSSSHSPLKWFQEKKQSYILKEHLPLFSGHFTI